MAEQRDNNDGLEKVFGDVGTAYARAMALLNNTANDDYANCVANCKSLFNGDSAALVACINGCAAVNTPAPKKLDVLAPLA